MVEKYWAITSKSRLRSLQSQNLTIQQYYSDFKTLNQPGGIYLPLKDYKNPMHDDKLSENWLLIQPKILYLAKKKSDSYLKEISRGNMAKNPKRQLEAKQTITLRTIVKAPRYVSNAVLRRDLHCQKLEDHFRDLSRRMFLKADKSKHPEIKDLAPHHARPPEGRRRALPRDLAEIQ
ncbi:hypothetical protein ACJJTC_007159 [Scirpophaga incertulas]